MKKELNWLFDYPNLKILQYSDGFKFSLDSILLAEFALVKKNDTMILDLCTGNGVVPTILAWKTKKNIVGIELQNDICELAIESAKINKLNDKISFICDDVKNIFSYYQKESFDVVLCNPPYYPYHDINHVNKNDLKKIARHEIFVDLRTIIKIASQLLHSKGRFYLVHLPQRIDEIIIYANEYHLAVKKIQFIYSKDNCNAKIVLVCLVKNGKFGVKVLPGIDISKLDTYQNLF